MGGGRRGEVKPSVNAALVDHDEDAVMRGFFCWIAPDTHTQAIYHKYHVLYVSGE